MVDRPRSELAAHHPNKRWARSGHQWMIATHPHKYEASYLIRVHEIQTSDSQRLIRGGPEHSSLPPRASNLHVKIDG